MRRDKRTVTSGACARRETRIEHDTALGDSFRLAMKFSLIIWIAAALPLLAEARLAKTGESVLDPHALILGPEGKFGPVINGGTFQNAGLLTHAGWQYAAYFNADRRVCLARRQLPDGEWQKLAFPDFRYPADNAHDTISMGISRGDGRIHVSFSQHVVPLRYSVSIPGQVFVGAPTWGRLGRITGNSRYFNYARAMWTKSRSRFFDTTDHLFVRDDTWLPQDNGLRILERNARPVYWARGMGWAIGGLALLLDTLPKDDPQRAEFEADFRKMAAALVACQGADGMWRASLFDPESYPMGETSATALIAYGLLWGVNHGVLDRTAYLPPAEKSARALLVIQESDGKLGYVQPGAESPRVAVYRASNIEYATGAFLLAGAEMLKLLHEHPSPAQPAGAQPRARCAPGLHRGNLRPPSTHHDPFDLPEIRGLVLIGNGAGGDSTGSATDAELVAFARAHPGTGTDSRRFLRIRAIHTP